MKGLLIFWAMLATAWPAELLSQPAGSMFSICLKGNYTTASRTFNHPDSPSDEIRSQYADLGAVYGAGLELRFRFPSEDFFISLSVEYLSRLRRGMQSVAYAGPPRSVPVEDGFQLVPIELGGNIFVPLGSEKVQLSMGGGVGLYYGIRVLRVAGVNAPQQNVPAGFGIHVESSFDYRVLPRVAVRADMRFHDPEVTTVNRFDQPAAVYNGIQIPLLSDRFRTRINVNGLNFGLGIVVEVF
jgi:hypothetical protein